MGSQLAQHRPDRRAAEIASAQHGVISRGQLLDAGMGARAVDHRVATGRLHPLHRGVYAVGHRAVTREGKWVAATLACGDGAVISHLDAAAVWRLVAPPLGPVDVTAPTRAGRARRAGIALHRVTLPAADATTHRGIAVTAPARTLVDLAAVLPIRAVERAVDEAHFLHLLQNRSMDETLERNAPRLGARRLATLLERHEPGSTRTRSELEERFLTLCASHGLPRPRVNTVVEGFEVDFLWPSAGVIVETDGYAAHARHTTLERDHERDRCLRGAGYEVLRFTWRQVVARDAWVATRVAAELSRRRPR